MSKIKLSVLGISYSQTQSGAYALVLSEEKGKRRIPIIIGGFEAQSIAIQLEGLKPPRPLTHDLFFNFATAFNIVLVEVYIYKLEEGVFFAKLICDNGQSRITVDARTSDSIALALRFKCPIYTTEEILSKSGIAINFEKESKKGKISKEHLFSNDSSIKTSKVSDKFKEFTIKELKEMLKEAIDKENYERASEIRDEILKKNKKL